ncbi:MAG: formylglycine-generating enzyme family protein [Candidatus Latescibacteria bacterium]|jgi:formylglycine-generating enzyme|nr:formylglycine-generating enzyme family protein [Candidatus Latescibacterota bacterium]MBT5829909.1 formylglycine-generating enzyme family protein [Candidatus Latescibacterota bacterium]
MSSACCGATRPKASIKRNAKKRRSKSRADASLKGMVHIPGGTFRMGTNDAEGFPDDGEGPIRSVTIKPFYMDMCAVTNAQFSKFAKATRYKTEAELFGWSFVFHLFISKENANNISQTVADTPWWWAVEDASWHQPEGAQSHIKTRWNHPVIHISWNDAMAYCEWSGKRLPTEAEWERAARGGQEDLRYTWGNELTPGNQHLCNIWQGTFPEVNTKEDGYTGTAPVTSFAPNPYNLYNISGNVWEWCQDWFSPDYHINGSNQNPTGPPTGQARVMRGGSYLCHESYCNRYRVAARSANTPDSSTGNLGFRCARDA